MKNLVKRVMAVVTTAVMALSLFSISAFADEPVVFAQADTAAPRKSYSYTVWYEHEEIFEETFTIRQNGSYTIAFDGAHGGNGVNVDFYNTITHEHFNLSIPAYTSGMPSPLTTTRNFTPGIYTITVSTQSLTTITGSFTVYV